MAKKALLMILDGWGCGDRPLKRYVQKYVETLTAKLILAGNIRANDRIVIDVENGELTAHTEVVEEVL